MLKADAPLGFPNRTHPAQISGELLPGGASAVGDLLAGHNGGDDFVVVVAEDHRAPGEDVVDELLARGVPHVGALGAVDEARGAAHGAEGSHGGVHAARNRDLRTLEEFVIEVHLFNS